MSTKSPTTGVDSKAFKTARVASERACELLVIIRWVWSRSKMVRNRLILYQGRQDRSHFLQRFHKSADISRGNQATFASQKTVP